MSLAQLRRDANSGNMILETIEYSGYTGDDIDYYWQEKRRILRANSVALFLQNPFDDDDEDEIRIQRANLIDYDGKHLEIYSVGERDLTEQEKAALDEWESIDNKYHEKNRWAITYNKRISYFKKCNLPWMAGYSPVNGRIYQRNGKVKDNRVRGKAIFKFKVFFDGPDNRGDIEITDTPTWDTEIRWSAVAKEILTQLP